MQRKGVRTTVVSTMKSNPPMVADELRRQADNFLELADIAHNFQRSYNREEGAEGAEAAFARRSEAVASRVSTAATTALATPANSSSAPLTGPVTPQSVLAQQSEAVALDVADAADAAEAAGEVAPVRRRGRPPASEKSTGTA